MLKKKFIAWTLACIALLMIAIPTIPHHHHKDMYTICLNTSDDAMDSSGLCDCDLKGDCQHQQGPSSDKKTCTSGCITNINAIKLDMSDIDHLQPFDFQLFNIHISELLISFLCPDKHLGHCDTLYIEKEHFVPLIAPFGKRATPFYNA